MSFKSLKCNEIYQQRINEMQSVQKTKPAMNGSLEGKHKIFDKTPDFRKLNSTSEFKSNSSVINKHAPRRNDKNRVPENEVIIYSDDEDEESIIKMIHNAPLQGTLSLINDGSQLLPVMQDSDSLIPAFSKPINYPPTTLEPVPLLESTNRFQNFSKIQSPPLAPLILESYGASSSGDEL